MTEPCGTPINIGLQNDEFVENVSNIVKMVYMYAEKKGKIRQTTNKYLKAFIENNFFFMIGQSFLSE